MRTQIASRPADAEGFVPLRHRWVVERTFGWLTQHRRHVKDCERTYESSESHVYISSVRLMLRRLTSHTPTGDSGAASNAQNTRLARVILYRMVSEVKSRYHPVIGRSDRGNSLDSRGDLGALLPEFSDINGWELRVQPPPVGPYIIGETYEDLRVNITLINKSGESRRCPPLEFALRACELHVAFKYPDGGNVRCYFEPFPPTRPEKWVKIDAHASVSTDLRLTDFGYEQFVKSGKHRGQVRFKTPQGLVTSRQWVMDVVEPDATTILASHTIPLDESYAKAPPKDQYKAFIQQVTVGEQVLLLYRSFWGGAVRRDRVDRCIRLAELPGKVEMNASVSTGRGKNSQSPTRTRSPPTGKTTLIIDSRGEPWSYVPLPRISRSPRRGPW